ncbi:hypothetical protein NM208_g9993 [Fusarium decemcellulare]|uniref:Uncharacterized protein n=1 Tax=Fusarium decemcellulare TaxID=57161 RepID=A0ACC1S009_9HYPO|nr:hypothetical protein NM208_g9993 [Fusarium decemcellulare]
MNTNSENDQPPTPESARTGRRRDKQRENRKKSRKQKQKIQHEGTELPRPDKPSVFPLSSNLPESPSDDDSQRSRVSLAATKRFSLELFTKDTRKTDLDLQFISLREMRDDPHDLGSFRRVLDLRLDVPDIPTEEDKGYKGDLLDISSVSALAWESQFEAHFVQTMSFGSIPEMQAFAKNRTRKLECHRHHLMNLITLIQESELEIRLWLQAIIPIPCCTEPWYKVIETICKLQGICLAYRYTLVVLKEVTQALVLLLDTIGQRVDIFQREYKEYEEAQRQCEWVLGLRCTMRHLYERAELEPRFSRDWQSVRKQIKDQGEFMYSDQDIQQMTRMRDEKWFQCRRLLREGA